jgi:class 3 adenylate cyclase
MLTDHELKSSEARLWQLIAERTQRDADTADIDRRIWDLFGEEWAIVFTDLAGFSRRTEEFGITHFLQTIYEQRELLLPIVQEHDGLLVKSEGDSFLLLFRRVQRALECALAMQRACQQINGRRRDIEQLLLCVGIGHGLVLRIGDVDVWGAEVNAAAKLGEDTAKPYEILLTGKAHAALREHLGSMQCETLGAVSGSAESYRLVWD